MPPFLNLGLPGLESGLEGLFSGLGGIFSQPSQIGLQAQGPSLGSLFSGPGSPVGRIGMPAQGPARGSLFGSPVTIRDIFGAGTQRPPFMDRLGGLFGMLQNPVIQGLLSRETPPMPAMQIGYWDPSPYMQGFTAPEARFAPWAL